MKAIGALHDFRTHILPAIPGLWARLSYTAELRQADAYDHPALAATHGSQASCAAIAAAHRDLFLSLLRTNLWQLLEDLVVSAEADGEAPHSYLMRLCQTDLFPANLGAGEREHFESVLVAMQLLQRGARN